MKTASARLMFDELGSDLPIHGLTPAEAVVLATLHMPNVKDYPLTDLVERDEIERSPINERRRLQVKYGRKAIAKLFPGAIPQFPTTFEEAKQAVLESEELATPGAAEMLATTDDYDSIAAKAVEKVVSSDS